MIQNPTLRGFCPDPSIVRSGEDYYIAASTFEWWPGVKLFHSRDLSRWEQLPGPLRRESQLDLRGDPNSGGVWAPCLSWDGNWFYLVFTDVKTKKGRFYNTHNYVVRAKEICGEWSEPVYLNSIGFDPSLFHDTDGKKYLINMVNGFRGVLVQEYDPEQGKLLGPQKKVYAGSGLGCTEGPHMYHIGKWYYLIAAEGGTGYDHCVTMARAESVWGPFETAPENPILTSDRSDGTALQKCGHADFVETQNGEWYMVHLCSRPLAKGTGCLLGRETAIQKMEWRDGWLRLACGGRFAQNQTPEPAGISSQPLAAPPDCDTFCGTELNACYSSPRVPLDSFASVTARPGWLRLTGHESLNSLHNVSLAARRQEELAVTASVRMEFSPSFPEQLAGLAYVYDSMHFYLLGKTADETGSPALTLLKSDAGVITDEMTPVPLPEGALELKAEVTDAGDAVQFFLRAEGGPWQNAGVPQTTAILTDEHCRGFTGAHFGMYAHDMTGRALTADFTEFTLRYRGGER